MQHLRISFSKKPSETGGILLLHIGDTDASVGSSHSHVTGYTFFEWICPSIISSPAYLYPLIGDHEFVRYHSLIAIQPRLERTLYIYSHLYPNRESL